MNKKNTALILLSFLCLHKIIISSQEDVDAFIQFCFFNKENPEYVSEKPSQTYTGITYWLSETKSDNKRVATLAFLSLDFHKKLTKITIPHVANHNSLCFLHNLHNKTYNYLKAEILENRPKSPYYKCSKIIKTQYGEMTAIYDGIHQSFSLTPTTPLNTEQLL